MNVFYAVLAVLVLVTIHDLLQTKHAVLRNFPLIGHFRYWLEMIGPELRQYIVTNNDEERPFSRDERRWIYASAKKENSYFGFGTDNDMERSSNYLFFKQSAFPIETPHAGQGGYDEMYALPSAKVLGEHRGRKKAFRPSSIVNISAMSFGSLSANAVSALNQGAKLAGCMHNTGEGGISPYHQLGGDLIWQLGTGYFGCRGADGAFSQAKLEEVVAQAEVRALEIKLSQGAKPGLGGVLPKAKITAEISKIRGIPRGEDCLSPAHHREFSDVDSMLDFVERLADGTGLPVGIKSAVGAMDFWIELADRMAAEDRGVDYIALDGSEGGTGAAPLTFADHVSLPFKVGFSRVYRVFAERGLADKITFVGSGRLGLPERAMFGLALGCDMIALAREPMLAVGCIQAQRCHTGHCPTGVATQSRWLMRGLDPKDKATRVANYIVSLRKEMTRMSHAMGKQHPALVTLDDCEILDGQLGCANLHELFGYQVGWGLPPAADVSRLTGS